MKAELAALELAGKRVEAGFQPDPVRAPQITAGPYAEAVADLGSPADSITEVRSRPEAVRNAADGVLVRALDIGLRRAPTASSGGTLPKPVVRQGTSALEDECIVVTPEGGRATVDLSGDALALSVQADSAAGVDAMVRNLASELGGAPLGTIPATETRAVALPRVRSGPWTIALSSTGVFRVC